MDFSLLWIQIWLLLFCKRSFETPNFSWHLIHAMKSVLKPRMFPGSTPRSLTFPPWAVDQPALVARGVLCVCIVRAYILYIDICICMYIYLIYIFCPMLVLCFGRTTSFSGIKFDTSFWSGGGLVVLISIPKLQRISSFRVVYALRQDGRDQRTRGQNRNAQKSKMTIKIRTEKKTCIMNHHTYKIYKDCTDDIIILKNIEYQYNFLVISLRSHLSSWPSKELDIPWYSCQATHSSAAAAVWFCIVLT